VLKGCKVYIIVEKIDFILIFAKIREKVGYSADMCCSGGKHPPTAGAELKILIFGAGGSSIRPLGMIRRNPVVIIFERLGIRASRGVTDLDVLSSDADAPRIGRERDGFDGGAMEQHQYRPPHRAFPGRLADGYLQACSSAAQSLRL